VHAHGDIPFSFFAVASIFSLLQSFISQIMSFFHERVCVLAPRFCCTSLFFFCSCFWCLKTMWNITQQAKRDASSFSGIVTLIPFTSLTTAFLFFFFFYLVCPLYSPVGCGRSSRPGDLQHPTYRPSTTSRGHTPTRSARAHPFLIHTDPLFCEILARHPLRFVPLLSA